MQTKILEKFIYSKDSVPKNYGKVFTLTEFNEKVKNYHCQSFMGMGYLIFDEKLVENSKEWIDDKFIKIDDELISLEELDTTIQDLKVFWISETELMF